VLEQKAEAGNTSVNDSTSLKPASPGRADKKKAEISARKMSDKPTLRERFFCSNDNNGAAISVVLMNPTP